MPDPARIGALIYANDLERLSVFYRQLLGMRLLHADAEHHVIDSADLQLIIHAIPSQIAATIPISSPPEPREEQAIKLLFTVPNLSAAATIASSHGGSLFGDTSADRGCRIRDGYDPEGNIFQLREVAT